MPPIKRPRGTEDLVGDQLRAMRRARDQGFATARRYGYQEIETPVFESTELFVRGVGETTDVVSREMYTFEDRGSRSLTLRPEGTAPTLRAYWETGLNQSSGISRLVYSGPMFRYDRPGRGRYRQFQQLGVEAIGDPVAEVDAEVIAIAWRWVVGLGVGEVTLQLNSIGDQECRPRFRGALLDYFEPHLDRLSPLDQERLRRNPLRVLDSKDEASAELIAGAPTPVDYLCPPCGAAFDRVQAALDAYGVPYHLNRHLVRGLDYYVRTAFELWHQSLQGAQNSLFGGGRYDGLSEILGYPPAAGVGFAAGLERVAMMISRETREPRLASYVCSAQGEAAGAAIRLAEALREEDLEVVCDAGERSLKAKMRAAERSGAVSVCLIGAEELADSTVSVRELSSGNQVTLALGEARARVAQWFQDAKGEGDQ